MPTYNGPAALKAADPKVVAGFWAALTETKADARLEVALFAAGLVEAALKNPTGGDRDSIGSLQQRSQGWGSPASRMDPRRAALLFLADATNRVLPKKPGVTPGVLAQLVQRSAYPDRYTQASKAAEYVIAQTRPPGKPDPAPAKTPVSLAAMQAAVEATGRYPEPLASALNAEGFTADRRGFTRMQESRGIKSPKGLIGKDALAWISSRQGLKPTP